VTEAALAAARAASDPIPLPLSAQPENPASQPDSPDLACLNIGIILDHTGVENDLQSLKTSLKNIVRPPTEQRSVCCLPAPFHSPILYTLASIIKPANTLR
jgi:hypothetical protein